MSTVHAVFENGVFKPTGPVVLPDACEVEFEPRLVTPPPPLSADQWVAEWRAWAAAMPKRAVTLDDSRESIYGDRG